MRRSYSDGIVSSWSIFDSRRLNSLRILFQEVQLSAIMTFEVSINAVLAAWLALVTYNSLAWQSSQSSH